jgi:hypothetical protein
MMRSRRDFLGKPGDVGGPGAVRSLLELAGRGQPGGAHPVRLLSLFNPNGSVPSRYWPTGGETDFTSPVGQITEPLAPYKAKMIFPQGLSRPARGRGGHESAFRTMWTGAGQTGSGGGFGGYAAGPRSIRSSPRRCRPTRPPSPACSSACSTTAPAPTPSVLTVMTYAGSGQPLAPTRTRTRPSTG